MAAYHEELVAAGMLVDASGLQSTSKGFKIRWADSGKPTVIDGPFTESKEIVAGYTVIEAASREEAVEWPGASPTRWAKAARPRSRSASSSAWRTSNPIDVSRFHAFDLPAQR